MEDGTYNGWTNYETWAVALLLDNDEATYRQMREQAHVAWQEAPESKRVQEWGWDLEDAAIGDLAMNLRELVESLNPVTGASLFADLMNAALSEVNWPEIAQHYIREAMDQREVKQGGE